jgi:hypothetical protein
VISTCFFATVFSGAHISAKAKGITPTKVAPKGFMGHISSAGTALSTLSNMYLGYSALNTEASQQNPPTDVISYILANSGYGVFLCAFGVFLIYIALLIDTKMRQP